MIAGKNWSERRDLNPRPLVPQTSSATDKQALTGDPDPFIVGLSSLRSPRVLSAGSSEPMRTSRAVKRRRHEGFGSTNSIFVVRLASSKQIVGIYYGRVIEDFLFEIDTAADPYECEFTTLKRLAVTWTGISSGVGSDAEEDAEMDHQHIWSGKTMCDLSAASWTRIAGNYVYFISAASLIKIGTTADLGTRLMKLRTGVPTPVEVRKIIAGGSDVERQMHARFAEHRAALMKLASEKGVNLPMPDKEHD